MAKLDPRLRGQILAALCEGNSQRSCQRIFGVEQNTVAKLLEDAGDMAIKFLREDMKGLTIGKIQADELYSFVGAKSANIDEMLVPFDGAGTVWCYLAMCAETKLIFSYFLGDRSAAHADAFMRDTASKLARKAPDGEFVVRPTIVTDGLKAYPEAISNAFGAYADYGMYRKKYTSVSKDGRKLLRKRYNGADRITISGHPQEADIHTAYMERQNLNVRMGNRRFTRKTNAFSKNLDNHERHLALVLLYRNYCIIPRPLQQLDDQGKPLLDDQGKRLPWIKRLTPAIEAGLTDMIWDPQTLLELTDQFVVNRRLEQRKAKKEAKKALAVIFAGPPKDSEVRAPFWVHVSRVHNSTKVHVHTCSNCNDGMGKKRGGDTKSGKWLGFRSLEEAKAAAEQLQPDRHSTCNMCLGSYRTRGY
jgi:IS1 family transposase